MFSQRNTDDLLVDVVMVVWVVIGVLGYWVYS